MVDEKTGPVMGIIGSVWVLGFAFISFLVDVFSSVTSGMELIYIRSAFSLSVGVIGVIGGILSFKGKRFANILTLVAGVMATVGIFISIGEQESLFSTIIYFDVILMLTGALVGLYIKKDYVSKKTQKITRKSKDKIKAEKLLFDFIQNNKGKAFTVKSLHKRIIENSQLDVLFLETEEMLYEMHLFGKFGLDIKDNINYYFAS